MIKIRVQATCGKFKFGIEDIIYPEDLLHEDLYNREVRKMQGAASVCARDLLKALRTEERKK